MTEIEPEELGPEIRQHQMAERAWQHPSEVGLESRCRVDQRRAVWIAGSVLLAVVALLGTGFALGATRPMEMSPQRQLSTQQASQMSADLAVNQRASLQSEYVAKVTIVSVAESTVAFMVLAKLLLTLLSWNVYCQQLLALPLARERVH